MLENCVRHTLFRNINDTVPLLKPAVCHFTTEKQAFARKHTNLQGTSKSVTGVMRAAERCHRQKWIKHVVAKNARNGNNIRNGARRRGSEGPASAHSSVNHTLSFLESKLVHKVIKGQKCGC